jgi:hypothetical protein
MTVRFLFSLILFLCSRSVSAQSDSLNAEKGDTLETIVSDTSIIYVIKQTPITIREKVEIVLPKEPKKFYLSIDFSLLHFSEYKKASASHQDYLTKLNSATKNKLSYSLSSSFWQCPKKIYKGIGISFTDLIQEFDYTSTVGEKFTTNNRFNYVSFSIQGGYWFKKNNRISCIAYAEVQGNDLISHAGYTINKVEFIYIDRLDYQMHYIKYGMSVSANLKFLLFIKEILLEVEPYLTFSPFSATPKNEYYSLKRSYIGLKLGVTNILFKLKG